MSASIGSRGFWLTVGPRGRRVTVGLPGTGLYWTPARVAQARLALVVVASVALLVLAAWLPAP